MPHLNYVHIKNKHLFSIIISFSISIISCIKINTLSFIIIDFNFDQKKNIIYNTFDYNGITHDKLFYFNGSKVLGPFNNAGADFIVNEIPEHNVLEVSFDLYTHDNWEGNKPTQYGIPDLFVMKYDGNPSFLTSFSSNTQYKQSYPEWFPQGSNPALGNAIQVDLPGRCAWKDKKNGTAMYRIVKHFPHSNKTFQLTLSDALQPFQSECEKSWSIDNLKITAFKYF